MQQAVLREPVGVCIAFTPWNFPFSQALRKVVAALASGCTIILKGPAESPSSTVAIGRLMQEAGLPDGCLNIVWGSSSHISETLLAAPEVRKISFTGSVEVGKLLAALAGRHMKRATMELGGHAPVMIFDDVDTDAVASLTSGLKYRNAGQVCISPTRFFVHEKAYDKFVGKFIDLAKGIKVGDGLEPDSKMGALANPRRVNAMESIIADVREKGGKVQAGGNRIGNQGNFFEPTVVTDVPKNARILSEEPFGPVAVMIRFKDTDEMLKEANSLPFGLASYAFTHNAKTATKLADNIDAGMITINHQGLALPEMPFGGVKDSGYGHEGGAEGLQVYMVQKIVSQLG